MRKLSRAIVPVILLASILSYAQGVQPPAHPDSFRFAVIGDSGTGAKAQYEVAGKLTATRMRFPFELVLMMGDNLYGTETPNDFQKKFMKPYESLIASGVKFFAALGNHDDPPRQINYKPFNMGGKRYYTFKPKEDIRFFASTAITWIRKNYFGSTGS